MKKLAIVTTHPIQYYAPVFRLLAEEKGLELRVFYTWGEDSLHKFDPGFGKVISWDIPLLAGYSYTFLTNTARQPGSHHFRGIQNPDIIGEIDAFAPHVLLVFGWAYRSHLQVMRYYKNRIPVWFRGDSTLLDETGGVKVLLKGLFLKWVYASVDKAFYTGAANKAYFEKYGFAGKQLLFAPHAIDNSRFAEQRSEEAAALRQQFGIRDADILVLFAGKLEPKKDPHILLEAFIEVEDKVEAEDKAEDKINKLTNQQINKAGSEAKVKDKIEVEINKLTNEQIGKTGSEAKVHLLFVGNGVLESSLKSRVSSLESHISGVSTRIHFMDFQNQQYMPVVYQACDLFCLPSKGPGETWGLAVNEAMAAGKAVLVSDKVGCAEDLVKPEINGYVFQAEHKRDLCQKLAVLAQNRQLLHKYGQASAKLIQDYSFVRIKTALLNALKPVEQS